MQLASVNWGHNTSRMQEHECAICRQQSQDVAYFLDMRSHFVQQCLRLFVIGINSLLVISLQQQLQPVSAALRLVRKQAAILVVDRW